MNTSIKLCCNCKHQRTEFRIGYPYNWCRAQSKQVVDLVTGQVSYRDTYLCEHMRKYDCGKAGKLYRRLWYAVWAAR